ncbi:MAG TPA: LysE family translocator [Spirochaetota bacterium]|nr:LysE family translocator [Spirochaetota bacterium]HPS87921.1 LysE family translocator [Spirochaetota bacterium]
MQDYNTLIIFSTASILLALAPGPDNLFVLTQSMLFGRSAGFKITLGLCTGLIFHTTLVSLGVAAIFQTSVIAFNALKYIGAAYLLYLAYGAFRASSSKLEVKESVKLSSWNLYRRGIIMNITNPKVSIFFMAFLPQFTDPSKGSITLQMFLLGFIFILATIIIFGMISQLAGAAGRLLSKSDKVDRVLNLLAGSVFAGLAVKLALIQQH